MVPTNPHWVPYEVWVQLGQPPTHHAEVEPDSRELLAEQLHGSVVQLCERETRARSAEGDELFLCGKECTVEVRLCGSKAA